MNYRILSTGLLFTWLVMTSCTHAASMRLVSRRGPYTFQVLLENAPVQTFYHRGETYILGAQSQRYTIRIHNNTGRRVEAVASVDGLDVIDGKAASWGKRGYLIAPWRYVDIDGWRLSQSNVAAFRFGSVSQSYAAQSGKSTHHVGVIGVAIFEEKAPEPVNDPIAPLQHFEDPEWDQAQPRKHSALRDSCARGHVRSRGDAMPAPKSSAPESRRHAEGESLAKQERPGLATQFGEVRQSHITHTSFDRASVRPTMILGARYNNRSGLIAMGVDVDGWYRRQQDLALRRSANPFPVSVGYAVPPSHWRGAQQH